MERGRTTVTAWQKNRSDLFLDREPTALAIFHLVFSSAIASASFAHAPHLRAIHTVRLFGNLPMRAPAHLGDDPLHILAPTNRHGLPPESLPLQPSHLQTTANLRLPMCPKLPDALTAEQIGHSIPIHLRLG